MTIKKPNVIIIGSAKCGTTTLASILEAHPDVCMSRPKEISFFQDTIDFKPNPNYEKGWPWYQKAFSHYNGEKLVCEATPSYSDRSRSPHTAKHIYEFNPDMKIIYMVRHPQKRQLSTWKMEYAFSRIVDPSSLDWKVEYEWASQGIAFWLKKQKEAGQWDECRYNYQLEAYRTFFDEDRIYVTFLEDWVKSQSQEVSNVLQFLGIQSDLKEEHFNTKENTADARGVESFFLKTLRRTSFLNPLKKILPYSVKQRISKNVLTKSIEYPVVPQDAFHEFNNYVKTDAVELIKKYKKDISFWNLEQ